MDAFIIEVSEQAIRRERDKSRELRKTRWWRNRVAQGHCHWCGGQFQPGDLTMDHIIPIARGGKASRNNVVPACKQCNSKKKYLLPMEWQDYLNQFNHTGSLRETDAHIDAPAGDSAEA